MKIAIGNDHAATELKFVIMDISERSWDTKLSISEQMAHESCNYPEYGEKVGRAVVAGEADCGVLICGTGVGISIAANKVNGVRAAVCSDCATARLVKEHNNANIIAFGAQYRRKRACKRHRKSIFRCRISGWKTSDKNRYDP